MLAGELIVDLFAGGGGASEGIRLALGRDPDIAVNHDAEAIAVHTRNHPGTTHHCASVWAVKPLEATAGQPVGLLWASPDCFPRGTMVLTREGYRPIEEVCEGDEVLTHLRRWRKVVETHRSVRPLISLRGHGHPGLLVSPEHPFYVRQRSDIWDNDRRRNERQIGAAEWAPASMLGKGWCWATPTEFPAATPPQVPALNGRTITANRTLMWLVGRYLADGWTRLTDTRAELVLTCGQHKKEDLRAVLAMWSWDGIRAGSDEIAWHERATSTAYQFTTNFRGLVMWLRQHFGHGAAEKRIPGWALGMDEAMRAALLAGYLSGDGWRGEIGGASIVECNTVSKALAFGIKGLAESLGNTVTVYAAANSDVIQGRKVNARPSWHLRWREEVDAAHVQTWRAEGLEWAPIREQTHAADEAEVFNIGVDEDESYVVDGIVVHNCRHFSRAAGGRPKWKSVRSLPGVVLTWATRVRPRVIVVENVREMLGWGPLLADGTPCPERIGRSFNQWVGRLRGLGYRVQWRELCAADFGAPTIRTRLFIVAGVCRADIECDRLHAEVASLRVSLGQQEPTYGAEPIGCPTPGACSAVAAAAMRGVAQGCVCPAGAEARCKGLMCPRRSPGAAT